MRITKFLARAGIASRRKAEQLIAEKRVKINGLVITKPFTRLNPTDEVTVDGVKVSKPEAKMYYMLNKPAGYLSTVTDPHGRKTVVDLLPPVLEARLYPVGRLDMDSEGLLLVTNDGELAYRLTHPRFEISKTYRVLVKGVPGWEQIQKLRHGVKLEDHITAPAKIKLKKREGTLRSWLEITIHEGRKRQVKNMCAAIGHPVIKLRRTQFAQLNVQGLKTGRYRRLTGVEVDRLYRLTGLKREQMGGTGI